VQHLTALTIMLALDARDAHRGAAELSAIIEDGVRAFLRAYR
jgi:hypothetical protein